MLPPYCPENAIQRPSALKRGVGLGPVRAGEPHRIAPPAPDQPEVVGVGEDDVRGAHVGLAQEARALGVGGGWGEGGGGEDQGSDRGWEGGARHRLGTPYGWG